MTILDQFRDKAARVRAKIDEGFCAYVLIALSPDEYGYGNPERIATELARNREVESVDVISGDWELISKIRTKDQDEYYEFLRRVISGKKGLQKSTSMISLKQIKTEFVTLQTKTQTQQD